MVAKILSIDSADGQIEAPRVLYTGTTRSYFCDTLSERGEFTHGADRRVHLTGGLVTAMSYAAQRAGFYGDSPVLLVVDLDKLDKDVYHYGEYETRALSVGSFLVYPFSLDNDGKFGWEEYCGALRVEEMVTQYTQEEIFRDIQRFLSGSSQ